MVEHPQDRRELRVYASSTRWGQERQGLEIIVFNYITHHAFSTDLAAPAGNSVILAGNSNYQQWAWNVEGTARLGIFWSAFDGTNTPDLTSTSQEASAQREMKALGYIMKTANLLESGADESSILKSELRIST